MCTPLAATAGIAVLNEGTSQLALRGQRKAEERNFAISRELAERNANLQYEIISQQRVEQAESAAREIEALSSQARRVRGRVRAQAAESGVAGQSVDVVLRDFAAQEARFQEQIIRQETFQEIQAKAESEAVHTTLQSQIFQAAPRTPKSSILGSALRIGMGVASSGISSFDPSTGTFPGFSNRQIP